MGLALAGRPVEAPLPAAPRAAPGALLRSAQAVAAAGLLFAGVVLLQARAGAFDSEFGAHPDESAHYVTGLMVRQYLASGSWGSPMSFAEDYYIHYPKVAFGQWPPLFYAVQAGWTLPFSPSRHSVLLLMAALTTGLAWSLFLSARGHCGALPALALALVLVASPLVQKASSMVMAETLVALLCFQAALGFGRFIDGGGQWRHAVLFGAWTVAALLAKGNAMALVLMVPVALLLAGRLPLALRPALWSSGAMVVVLCGPWYWLTAGMAQQNFMGGPGPNLGYARFASWFYLWHLARAVGWGMVALAALGLAATARATWVRRRGQLAAAAALVLATWVFHLLMPSSREPRHMIMAVAPLLLLAGAGLAWIEQRLRAQDASRRAALALAALLVFALDAFAVPPKAWRGFSGVAERLVSDEGFDGSNVLVCSDERGEGMFISEVARRQPRPRRLVLRASKVLARSGWNGEGYQLLHDRPEELQQYLEGAGVAAVVLDESAPAAAFPHHRMLRETLARDGRWAPMGSFPLDRAGMDAPPGIVMYRWMGAPPRQTIAVDPRELLRGKRVLPLSPSPEAR